jgi:hypothetical protein
MQKLRKIGSLSLGIMLGLINLILGLIWAIVQLVAMSNPQVATMVLDPTVIILGNWILLIYPLVYGIVGFISGVVLAWIYNLLAAWTGGITVVLNDKPSRKSKRK